MAGLDEIIDEICENIAEMVVEAGMETMWSMVVNAGQETLVGDIEGDYLDQVEAVAEGEFEPVDTDVPEAIGIICDVGNAYLAAGAEICNQIREAANLLD